MQYSCTYIYILLFRILILKHVSQVKKARENYIIAFNIYVFNENVCECVRKKEELFFSCSN